MQILLENGEKEVFDDTSLSQMKHKIEMIIKQGWVGRKSLKYEKK